MKKNPVILLVILVAFVLPVYWYIAPQWVPPSISSENFSRANTKWQTVMIEGIGLYAKDSVLQLPNSESEDVYREDPTQAVYGRSGIRIHQSLKNGYLSMEGGPIDIVHGSEYDYVLYGRRVGQYYMRSKLSWNNEYHYLHTDYYLVKRGVSTKSAELVSEWLSTNAQYASMRYVEERRILLIRFCPGREEEVPVDGTLFPDEGVAFVTCTSPVTP